ncbi:MAG: hypothetical protein NVS4B13_03490 [Candidatus Elarobacter sp.]
MTMDAALRALASERRRQILAWLRDPRAHFPPQWTFYRRDEARIAQVKQAITETV